MAKQTPILRLLLSTLAALASFVISAAASSEHHVRYDGHLVDSPTVKVHNGSYYGLHNTKYNQDFFLGIPFAQPPTGQLRLRTPHSLNTSWEGLRNATQYSPICVGYNQVDGASEDCLTLNVIRPSGYGAGDRLPVLVWIYGGGFIGGGSAQPQYNLSFIVQQSVAMGTPIVAVSLNYRLHCWGYLWSKEVLSSGVANLGFRDQRLALHWLQENIDAFGGDATKVTIWGESAGGNSVGTQLIAYGGRDDKLFRAAISQSGAPSTYYRYQTPEDWQPFYDAIVKEAGCESASDTLDCLRDVPYPTLQGIFDNESIVPAHTLAGQDGPKFVQVIDGDFVKSSATTQLRKGQFVKVPYIIGGNSDEGSSFAVRQINTTAQFLNQVQSWGVDNTTANVFAALYPNIPQIGIPKTMTGAPPSGWGVQYKRVAAFQGDINIHAPRRLANMMWAAQNTSSYAYFFQVINNGSSALIGSPHGAEVAYTFGNVDGVGYANGCPLGGKSSSYRDLALLMSRMWISFATRLDPNYSGGTLSKVETNMGTGPADKYLVSEIFWPEYELEDPKQILFDANVSHLGYSEPDLYRAEAIAYLMDNLDTAFGH